MIYVLQTIPAVPGKGHHGVLLNSARTCFTFDAPKPKRLHAATAIRYCLLLHQNSRATSDPSSL